MQNCQINVCSIQHKKGEKRCMIEIQVCAVTGMIYVLCIYAFAMNMAESYEAQSVFEARYGDDNNK